MKTWNNTDKSDWIEGEWKDEPDKCQWVDGATGLDCLIVRGPFGALCGYVGVPESHPYYGKSYKDLVTVSNEVIEREYDIDKIGVLNLLCADRDIEKNQLALSLVLNVHGGITFSDSCSKSSDPAKGICHTGNVANKEVWWLGFDCAHAGDITPGSDSQLPREFRLSWVNDTYKNIDYVKQEVESLAAQIMSNKQ